MKSTMKTVLLGAVVLVGSAGAVLLADSMGWLGNTSPVSDTESCPHTLDQEDCPFCNEALIESMGMCLEHAVPEALCYQCRPQIIPAFKATFDWCGEHGVPESQCYICNPAKRPGRNPEVAVEDEPDPSLLRELRPPDPFCPTDQLRVEFVDPEIEVDTGLEFVDIEKRPTSKEIICPTTLSYDLDRYVKLSSRLPGIVHAVEIDLGSSVTTGDTLILIESIELGRAKVEYLKLLGSVETARMKLTRAEENLERLRRVEVQSVALDYLSALDRCAIAERNYEREQSLMEREATSEIEVLEAKESFLTASSECRSLSQKLIIFGLSKTEVDSLSWEDVEQLDAPGTTSSEVVLDASIDLQEAQAALVAATSSLRLFGIDEAGLEELRRSQDTSSLLALVAPFSGVVVERAAVVGELVTIEDVLVAVADIQRIWALLEIADKDISGIRLGQHVAFRMDGVPTGAIPAGHVDWISAELDARTRTLAVRAVVSNPDGVLKANMFGEATVRIRDEEPTLLVPKSAVQWEGCCNVVFVRRSATSFEPHKVELAFETGDDFAVVAGLSEGDRVVTTGSYLLKTEIMKGAIGAGCTCVE